MIYSSRGRCTSPRLHLISPSCSESDSLPDFGSIGLISLAFDPQKWCKKQALVVVGTASGQAETRSAAVGEPPGRGGWSRALRTRGGGTRSARHAGLDRGAPLWPPRRGPATRYYFHRTGMNQSSRATVLVPMPVWDGCRYRCLYAGRGPVPVLPKAGHSACSVHSLARWVHCRHPFAVTQATTSS